MENDGMLPTHRRKISEGSYRDMAGYQCIGIFMRHQIYLTDFSGNLDWLQRRRIEYTKNP